MPSPIDTIPQDQWKKMLDDLPQTILGISPNASTIAQIVIAYTLLDVLEELKNIRRDMDAKPN